MRVSLSERAFNVYMTAGDLCDIFGYKSQPDLLKLKEDASKKKFTLVQHEGNRRTFEIQPDPTGTTFYMDKKEVRDHGIVFRNFFGVRNIKSIENFGVVTIDTFEVIDGKVRFTLPAELPAPRGSQPLQSAMDALKKVDPAPQILPVISLRDAVRVVNEHKRQMGTSLALSITEEGYLKALMEIE